MRGTKERSALLFHFAGIGWAADHDKAPVAIAAFHSAAFVDFEPDFRVAQRGGNIGPAAIAGNAVRADEYGFRRVNHPARLANAKRARNVRFIENPR